MCGIVGIISKSKIDKEKLIKMRDKLSHRGPDDNGIFLDEKIGLGHRRLSILDLSEKGKQPMIYKNYVISYNGEVYNFKEIKKELKNLGYTFFSGTDTEVVLKSFAEWGNTCFSKFRGMFAGAIWDGEKLTLFRDRFGIKPMYYYANNSIFLFGSELKAIKGHIDFRGEESKEGINYYNSYGYIPAPFTDCKNTYKLEEGSFLEVDKNLKIKKTCYFKPESFFGKEKLSVSEERAVDLVEEKLTESVMLRTISDVPIGVFLSGGVDSSLITAILTKHLGEKVKTFTIGFKNKDFNEALYAKKIAKYLGTEHNEYYVSDKEIKKGLKEYEKLFDEPFGDKSSIPTFILSKLAREKVKVVLAGDGGDEMFLGYDKYKATEKIKKLPYFLRRTLKTLSPAILSKILKQLNYTNSEEKAKKLTRALSGKNIKEIFALASSKNNNSPIDIFSDFSGLDFREKMQLWDIQNFLADDILVKTDRTTMANGLECRVPFVDIKILELSGKLDIDLKKDKYILRKILEKYIPRELFERPKMGFNIPRL